MNNPLVSIYIVTCNRCDLLKRCLQSIQQQTYSNLDIIVVDDASSDGTSVLMEKLIENDKRISYYRNEENRGACFSRNIAITRAKGVYITGTDDDDYFIDTRIEGFVNKSKLLNKFCFIFSSNLFLHNNKLKKSLPNRLTKRSIGYNDLIDYNAVGNQVFIKTEILKKYLFDVQLPAWQDFECWYRILFFERKKAYNVSDYSYVQDVQHDKDRISNKKIDKIFLAKSIFIKKHSLSKSNILRINNHLRSYEGYSNLRFESLFSSLIKNHSFFIVFLIFFYFSKYIKARFF